MKKRRLISSAIALLLAVCMLPLSAFADTWYLEDGDITVSANENGQTVQQGSKAAVADNNATITVDADYAILTGKLSGIKTLEGQGIEEIVFVTNGATSAFETDDLLEQGGETYLLTHDGKTVTFTAGAKLEDISEILE